LESSLAGAEPPPEDEEGEGEMLSTVTAPRSPLLLSFADVVRLAGKRREAKLKVHLEEHVSLVKFDPAGSIELHLLPGAPKELANELREKLNLWTQGRWMVALSKNPGERPLGEVERARAAAEIAELRKHPAVAAVLQQFPDAEIASVRPISPVEADDTGTG
jgi:DNA polymerase-3 subunit gamma/tau